MILLNVKEIAREKKISQSKLSRLADIDPSTMQRIFSGQANITLETLNRLVKALNVQPGDLLRYVPDE